MTEDQEERQKNLFLYGLARLTHETGVRISGCGCCGSPALDVLPDVPRSSRAAYGYGSSDEVLWLDPSIDDADWDFYSHTIPDSDGNVP
jgi:hypothetical protein